MDFLKSVTYSYSEMRLQKLISERVNADINRREEIDKKIWNLFGEKWAIMFTDLSGFSRGVEKFGIIHFIQVIHESERVLTPIIEDFGGIVLKTEGDSLMVIFRSTEKAVMCSIEMQKESLKYNESKEEEEQIHLCIGLGYGDVLRIGDSDVFGAEVNAASKLGEDIAKSGEILVTEFLKNSIIKTMGVEFKPIEQVPAGAKKAFKMIY